MTSYFINIGIFTSAVLLLVATISKSMLIMFIALILAVMTQTFYRKKYPRKNKSFRELLDERSEKH
ncbi:hypothetical protein [Listeria fleischmannii]|uniref:hypothetical protein n=1 Tax=Listeria fleischmannii TaxID=1069827 RepID=UPI0021AB3207|nr:hypothetical protein [Listeria fleischmannii]